MFFALTFSEAFAAGHPNVTVTALGGASAGRRQRLNQANKLSRTYAALTDALDRHRGKGQQRITVEHVNVHAGGQAIVGAVTPGDGSSRQSEEQTRAAREITHEPGIPMRSPDPQWETLPIAAGARKAPV